MAKQKTTAKSTDRGKFLTIVIVVMFLLMFWDSSTLITNADNSRTNLLSKSFLEIVMYILLSVASWVSLYGIWKFKKWGVYLFFGSSLVGLISGMLAFKWSEISLGIFGLSILLIFTLIILAILFLIPLWAIKRKWHLFK